MGTGNPTGNGAASGCVLTIIGRLIRMLHSARVPVLGCVLLAGFPIFAVSSGKQMLRNIFDMSSAWEAVIVGLAALLAAWSCGLLGMLAASHGAEREGRCNSALINNAKAWVLVAFVSSICAVPAVYAMFRETSDRSVLFGLLVMSVPIVLLAIPSVRSLPRWAEKIQRARPLQPLAQRMAGWPGALWDGYLDPNPAEGGRRVIYLGHCMAALLMVCLAVLFVLGLTLFNPFLLDGSAPGSFRQLPAAACLLLQLTMVVTFLAGVAFFFDRFRVPTLLLAVLWVALCQVIAGPRAVFLTPLASPAALPSAAAPLRAVQSHPNERYRGTAVVVCASGGGIHAAAWTAMVLCWLQQEAGLGTDLMRAVRYYSATSGGSVGVMYYLCAFDLATGAARPGALADIPSTAARSSLAEAAWGLAFPDFARGVAPIELVFGPARLGRADALERAWGWVPSSMGAPGGRITARWSEWARLSGDPDGLFPGVLFNSFDIDSGRRVLLSTVELPRRGALTMPDLAAPAGTDGGGLLHADMPVVTAARLSATFPYVTPVARPRLAQGAAGLSAAEAGLADGGYFDNSGLLGAIDWILAAEEGFESMGIERVVIVEIRAFTPPVGPARAGAGARLLRPFSDLLFGPVQGLASMRTASQVHRGTLEICLLRRALQGRVRVERVVFDPGGGAWPLSWHMSDDEFRSLERTGRLHFEQSAGELRRILESPVAPPQRVTDGPGREG